MSDSENPFDGALPYIKNASSLTMKLLAMKPNDSMDISPFEIPRSYQGIGNFIGRLARKYPVYFAILKLEDKPGWRIIRVSDLVTLKKFSSLQLKSNHMEEKQPEREFNMSDAKLAQVIDEKIIFGTRDSTEMIPRGVTALRLTALGAANAAFKILPADSQMVGGITEAVETRQSAYDTLTDKIGNVRTMAQNIYGEGSGTYNRFGFKGMISLDDVQLVSVARQIQTEAVAHAGDLLPEGWDAAFALAFDAAIIDFDNKRDLVRVAEADRKQATANRINAGNSIYRELVKICNTGKDVFRISNPVKHDDYVIYDPVADGNSITVEQGVPMASIVNQDIENIATTPLSTIKLVIIGTLRFYFSAAAGDSPGAVFANFTPGTYTMLVEDFKTLTGFSLIVGIPYLNIQNIGGTPGHYKLTFTDLEA